MQAFKKVGLEAHLTPDNCAVVMIDHQPFQLANVNSHEPTMVINNAIGLAMTAKAYGIPTILTTVNEERGGRIFKGIQDIFPDHKTINRTYINAWEDQRVVEAVKKTGRRKVVFAALWTEMCLAMPAIQAMGDGYDIYIVTDASGGVSVEAHDMAIRRLLAAGAQPITWLAMAGGLQRDWARTQHLGGCVGHCTEKSAAHSPQQPHNTAVRRRRCSRSSQISCTSVWWSSVWTTAMPAK
jgi:nicotinamidase-related amidase